MNYGLGCALAFFTGENIVGSKCGVQQMAAVSKVKNFAPLIREHWQKATESIYLVAALCAEANSKLKPADKAKLIEQLPFSISTFGRCP